MSHSPGIAKQHHCFTLNFAGARRTFDADVDQCVIEQKSR